jgi:thiamine pyrophosphokinase
MPAEGISYHPNNPLRNEEVFFMSDKRAVIFVNGVMADPQAVRMMLRPDDYLVAVDGGLQHLQTLGVQPQLLIGDLDSLDEADVAVLESAGVRIERHPAEKDETDLELALLALAGQGYDEIRVVAALGGRLDQTLANLSLLELPGLEDVDVRLDDGHEEILIIRDFTTIDGHPGDTVSLLARDGCTNGITTEGLKYPLTRETLCPNRTRGISNEMLSEQASVKVASGRLLCVHTRKPSPN